MHSRNSCKCSRFPSHAAELNGCVTELYDRSYVCQVKRFDDKVRWLNMTFHMLQVPHYEVPKYVLKR